jgi:hypothetical protein
LAFHRNLGKVHRGRFDRALADASGADSFRRNKRKRLAFGGGAQGAEAAFTSTIVEGTGWPTSTYLCEERDD